MNMVSSFAKSEKAWGPDFAEIIALYTKFKDRIFDLLKQINTFDDRGTLIATDRRKLYLVTQLLGHCPVFLHSMFRDKTNGNTVLHEAIAQSHDVLVKHIFALSLSNKCTEQSLLNCKNVRGYTPLELAVRLDRRALLEWFLECAYLGRTSAQRS